ncbi:MAG TPA: hypothetical protein VI756_29215 [Blastocatellia bacterium]
MGDDSGGVTWRVDMDGWDGNKGTEGKDRMNAGKHRPLGRGR